MPSILETLQARGLFEAMTSPELAAHVRQPTTVYAGFDPTSRSLQIGNLVAVMGLAHFQRAGHKVVALVGGATGMIGDPSGKSQERPLLSAADVAANVEGIRENLGRFLDFESRAVPAKIVNNQEWMHGFSYIDFLREVGKHFRMGAMLARESVRARLESTEGMSYTEFSYQLLQAYDFLHLCDTEGCRIQIGGSDQWGNITAGTDLIRRLRGVEAFGLTFPILCDHTGAKFGKSAGNAVYLDATRTSCYDFYQYFLRSDDQDVIRYLKMLTFLPLESIEAIEEATRTAPDQRLAQRTLAEELTRMVHGENGLRSAEQASAALFGGTLAGLNAVDLLAVFTQAPSSELPRAQVVGQPLVDVAVAAGLVSSKSAARRLIADGGLYVNNERMTDATACVTPTQAIEDRLLVLRQGKRNYRLVRIV